MYAVHLQADDPQNARYLIAENNEGLCASNLQSYINSIAYLERKKFDESKSEDRPNGFDLVRKSYYQTAGFAHDLNLDQLKKLTREYIRAMFFNLQVSFMALRLAV